MYGKDSIGANLDSQNNKYSLNFMLTLSKWISNPTFSCEEFHVIKNTLFVVIAATKSGGKYHHNNILSVLNQNQKEDEETVKKKDTGTKKKIIKPPSNVSGLGERITFRKDGDLPELQT